MGTLKDDLRRLKPVIKDCNGFIDHSYDDGVMALFHETPDDAVRCQDNRGLISKMLRICSAINVPEMTQ
jgi:hypothetical protein